MYSIPDKSESRGPTPSLITEPEVLHPEAPNSQKTGTIAEKRESALPMSTGLEFKVRV